MTDIVLLDGSIGQELVARSGDRATPLWSTRVMMDHPEMVGAVHDDYFTAGATIASTNTYAVHRSRLERVGLADQLPHLIQTAIDQAEQARARHGGRIAGVLGPLLASYRPDLNPDPDDAALKFGELVTLMAPRVDLFLFETVSSRQEAEGALRATRGAGKPVWIALSVRDENGTELRSGEKLSDMRPLLDRFNPDVVLLNCSRPEAVSQGMGILKTFDRPFGGYANGFKEISAEFLKDAPTVDALERRDDLTPATYADHVMSWVGEGATYVGGCCETGPDHIAEIATRLRGAGHRII